MATNVTPFLSLYMTISFWESDTGLKDADKSAISASSDNQGPLTSYTSKLKRGQVGIFSAISTVGGQKKGRSLGDTYAHTFYCKIKGVVRPTRPT